MKLHKFTCTECKTTPFYTSFSPIYDDSFCPCCGQDKTVTYQGPVMVEEVVKRGQSEVA
jgi:uncharacterized protein CbrC (UPF0167 family)